MATTTSEEFEKATDYQFKEEDIERAKALVGRWAPSGAREFLTTATPDAMRNFARGYGDDNPLFASEDYGTTTRWGGQIAPPMIPIALNRPALRRSAEGADQAAVVPRHPRLRLGQHLAVVPPAPGRRPSLQLRRHRVGGGEEVRVRRALAPGHLRQREDEPAGRDRRHLADAGHPHRAQDGPGEGQVLGARAGDLHRRGHREDRRHLRRRGGPGAGAPLLGGRARRRRAATRWRRGR